MPPSAAGRAHGPSPRAPTRGRVAGPAPRSWSAACTADERSAARLATSRRMPVHEIAQRGFDAEAVTYDRTRPSYPPAAVAWLVEHLGIGPGRRVVDLAAGTGKLTVLLEPSEARVVAVEPVEGMR